MATERNNGGYAYPVAWPAPNCPEPGMYLRDYFAAQAVGACFREAMERGFTGPQPINEYTSRAAFWAYQIADAMLVERGIK